MLLQKGVLCLQENLYMFRILQAQSKLVLQPVTCIALLMRNFMKSEVNIQAMPGVLIDIILIFFLDRVSIKYTFLKIELIYIFINIVLIIINLMYLGQQLFRKTL